MKKKILVLLLSVASALCVAFGLSGCAGCNKGENDAGEHNYVYKFSATEHWLQCTDSDCNAPEKDRGVHTVQDGVCTACGYVERCSQGLRFEKAGNGYEVYLGTATDEHIYIPSFYGSDESVTGIGNGAFKDCANLKQITLSNTLTYVGDNAFEGCSNLTSITLPDSVTTVGKGAFVNSGLYNDETNWEDGVLYLGDRLIAAKQTVPVSYAIKVGTKSIADGAFEGCYNLTSLTIPQSLTLTSIGKSAFSGCYKLVEIIKLSADPEEIKNPPLEKGSDNYGGVAANALNVSFAASSDNSMIKITKDGYIFYDDGATVYLVNYEEPKNDDEPKSEPITTLELPQKAEMGNPDGKDYILTDNYKINQYAFYNNTILESITIPDSVMSVGNRAFSGCEKLTNIKMPESIIFTSIGDRAFSGCTSLESITIPDSVNSIGRYAFEGCTAEIKWGEKPVINEIGESAFGGYMGTSVTIPDSVTSVGYSAFYNCSNLTSITIPQSVTSIGGYAFYNCTNLASITIPDSIISIGNSAFYNCTGLETIEIPDSVTFVGGYAFFGDTAEIKWGEHSAIEKIGDSAFAGYMGTSVTIPGSVTSVGRYAFYNCTDLTSITIPQSVTSIGDNAFYNCTDLTSITIPQSVTSIGEGTFYNCTGLETIEIPNGVTSVGKEAFGGCTAVIKWGDNPAIKEIGDSAFAGYMGTSVVIPDNVTSVGAYAFSDCKNLESINIIDGVKSIGESAFKGCTALAEINIPDSVTEIGKNAFRGCTGLETITIGNGLSLIDESTFLGCTKLTSVTIKDGVSSIGGSAFRGCTTLTDITLPDSVTEISEGAFSNCTGLELITFGNGLTSIGKNAFSGVAAEIIWGNSPSIKEIGQYAFSGYNGTGISIPDGVTSIGSGSFSRCMNLESITIPDSVTEIGEYAFQNCTTEIKWGGNPVIEKIGNGAFSGYMGTSITIPNSVTSIGSSAFKDCSFLTNITLPDNVSSIDSSAFSGCKNLVSITIPNNVTSIGWFVFSDCTSLEEVTIGNSVTEIGGDAFSGCTSLENITVTDGNTAYSSQDGILYNKEKTEFIHIPKAIKGSVTIPDGVTSIGRDAFSDCKSLESIKAADGNTAYSSQDGILYNKNKTEIIIVPKAIKGSVTIPNGVTSIDNYTFSDCKSLESIKVADGNTAYSSQDGILYNKNKTEIIIVPKAIKGSVTIPNGVTSIDNYAFSDCKSLESVIIPDSVASISYEAFYNCTILTSITVAEGNTRYSSQDGVLYNKDKTGLIKVPQTKSSINIPDSVTSIGSSAFSGCESLTSISIPNSVISIGSNAFYNCTVLETIEIPDSVISIGSEAFGGCTSLENITVTDGNTAYSSQDGILYNKDKTRIIFVPKAIKGAVIIPDSVTSIDSGAFGGCTSLESVTIGNGVTSIGGGAFGGCTSLESVIIGNGVTSIGGGAFYGCESLTSVKFENSNGWYRASSSSATSGTDIPSEDLQNTETAATYLRSTYSGYEWKRKTA